MPRRTDSAPRKALSRVTGAVKRTAARVTKKLHHEPEEPVVEKTPPRTARAKSTAQPARKRRPQTDVPIATLNATYIPQQTSLKAPFRASGSGRQGDQVLGRSIADDRWNDEDRLTNKSGDPRIGTHGRTYEPGESRTAKRRK